MVMRAKLRRNSLHARNALASSDIRPLTLEEQSRFTEVWKKTQARFVDEPSEAVGEADGLIKEVMQTRGYPVGEFDQRAADVSVDHPNVVTNYRAGREIAARNKSGEATRRICGGR